MIEFSQQARIGAVGPFLLRRDGTIDSAGLVLGVGDALQGAPAWTRGHLSNALDVRNASAVSGACLLTRRDVFERLGGFDERFGEALFAVDYGLRLREAGLRVVVTPHARDVARRRVPARGRGGRGRSAAGALGTCARRGSVLQPRVRSERGDVPARGVTSRLHG